MVRFGMRRSLGVALLAAILVVTGLCGGDTASADGPAAGGAAAGALLSGRVYEGEVGVETTPLAGVTVTLYGSNGEHTLQTSLASTSTDATGWFGLTVPEAPQYEFYNIVETDPDHYTSTGATTVGGTVVNDNWIQYMSVDGRLSGTLTGNKFYDRSLVTRTPTATQVPATATPTATRTTVPPTATASGTSLPATATATLTHTTVPPTATAMATGTQTVPPPTSTQTQTSVPPTATATATGTQTVQPPTSTPTGTTVPLTATTTATGTQTMPPPPPPARSRPGLRCPEA
jgi:hypothetical protein